MFLYLITLLISLRMLLSLYEIPSSALAPELTLDYDQRTGLMSWRFFFGTIGGAGMTWAAFRIFLRHDATHPLGIMNRTGWGYFGLAGGIVMFGSIMVSCLGTHRFIAALVQTPRRVETWMDKVREVTATLSNRSFLALMISGLIGAVGTGLSGGLELYINNYFWELSPKQLSLFPLIALVAAFLGVALAPALSRRFGKKRALLIGYSQGADVLPFAVNRLPEATRSRVALTAILGMSEHALFEFHVSSWISDDNSGPPTLPEVNRITGVPVLCIYGEDEKDSLCPKLDAHRFKVVKVKGGHHFDGDYAGLAREIMAAAKL